MIEMRYDRDVGQGVAVLRRKTLLPFFPFSRSSLLATFRLGSVMESMEQKRSKKEHGGSRDA